jgi:hypothetical protein
MNRPPTPLRHRARPRLIKLALGLFGATAIPMAARAVDPRAGVIGDAPRQVFFDREGLTIGLTRHYDRAGSSNRLLAQLSGSPPQREFQLSSGQLCEGNQQHCWDRGWRRRNVNPLLSRQIFGPSPTTGPAMGTAPVSQRPPAGELQCELLQRGLTVFKGLCRLYRQNETVWQYYVVQMDNGKLYRFQRRASQLVLSDATGTWPVFISDRGNAVQFRWANRLLEVSRPRQARGGAPDGVVPPMPTPRSTGETGQDLLENIFP